MARSFGRQVPGNEGDEPPPGFACLSGELGPWTKTDRPEFYHAGTHAQQWFLRLDQADVEAIQYAVSLGSWVRSAVKWVRRAFWCFTVGLGAALTVGENLQKLPGMISSTLSALRGLIGA